MGAEAMRLDAWTLITLEEFAAWVWAATTDRHLTTDPACVLYVAPLPGSRLDRASRGRACTRCMGFRA
jgi:hypothetical protein